VLLVLLGASSASAVGPNYCSGAQSPRPLAAFDFEGSAFGTDTCGATPQNFTNSGVAGDTVAGHFAWHAQAGAFVRTESDKMTCADATCTALDLAGANQPFSICARVRLSVLGEAIPHDIYSKDRNTSSPALRGIRFDLSGTDKLRITLEPADCTSGQTTLTDSTAITDTTLHHVCVTSDDVTLKLYLDGAQRASVAYTAGICGNTINATIGALEDTDPAYAEFMQGNIDELGIWNAGLTATQVCDLCRCGIDGGETDHSCGNCTGTAGTSACSFIAPTATVTTTPPPTVTSTAPTPTPTATPTSTLPTPTATSTPVAVVDLYLNPSGTDTANCGTTPGTACRTYAYWYASGCDVDGCANNVLPGAIVHFAAGTYTAGEFAVPFDGTAAQPWRLQCDGAAGSCILSGSGQTSATDCGLLAIGASPAAFCSANAATYGVIDGFTLASVATGSAAAITLTGTTGTHDIALHHLTHNGASTKGFIQADSQSRLTITDTALSNQRGPNGATFLDNMTNLAFVGNTITTIVVGDATNKEDCFTTRGAVRALIDGNTCASTEDGFDNGKASQLSQQPLGIITRYNIVKGATARAFPASGQCDTASCTLPNSLTLPNTYYKNLAVPLAAPWAPASSCTAAPQGSVLALHLRQPQLELRQHGVARPRGDYTNYFTGPLDRQQHLPPLGTDAAGDDQLIVLDQTGRSWRLSDRPPLPLRQE
jgi:hypothetical protein